MTGSVIAELEGHIGFLTFDNQVRRNAVSLKMWQELAEGLEAFAKDDNARVVVLRGAGDKAFVAGADISQFDDHRKDAEGTKHYDEVSGRATHLLATFPKPTIAKIQGFCIGGGLAIALGCDMRIASDDSTFAIPAARLGLGYGPAGIKTLIDLVGPSFAKEIFFTARQFTAAEAYNMGLINHVCTRTQLSPYVVNYCETISGNAPMTIHAVKVAVGELLKPNGGNKELCDRLVAECFESEDYKEGRAAFMDKRTPKFKGK
jgi:enoyl-CoA hydratase/carnithine racemase